MKIFYYVLIFTLGSKVISWEKILMKNISSDHKNYYTNSSKESLLNSWLTQGFNQLTTPYFLLKHLASSSIPIRLLDKVNHYKAVQLSLAISHGWKGEHMISQSTFQGLLMSKCCGHFQTSNQRARGGRQKKGGRGIKWVENPIQTKMS